MVALIVVIAWPLEPRTPNSEPRAAYAYEDISVPLRRQLAGITLGQKLKKAKALYPPTREWPAVAEPGGEISRVVVERIYARNFPEHVATLQFGVRRGRIVRVRAIYDEDQTHKEPLEDIVVRLATTYGEPRRQGTAYLWKDKSTLMRAANEEVPLSDGSGMQILSSLEIMNVDVYRP